MTNTNPNKRLSVSETMRQIKVNMRKPSVIAAQNALIRQAEKSESFRSSFHRLEKVSAYKACTKADTFDEFLRGLELDEFIKRRDRSKKIGKPDPVVATSTSSIDGREYKHEWRGRVC